MKKQRKRGAKITEMLNNRQEKKIKQKLTSDAQFLNYAKEDLELKRKLLDRLDKEDSDFKESMTKINKTMETVGESISQSMHDAACTVSKAGKCKSHAFSKHGITAHGTLCGIQ